MPKKASVRKGLTRRELRDLDIEISFLEGVVRRDGSFVEALQLLGDGYTRRGRYDSGLKVDEQLSQLRPSDPLVLYNLACSYALTKRCEQSASTLIRAIELGYNDFKWLMRDPDLEDLHQHPVFEKVRAKIKRVKIHVK
jgi:hypothetical protein